MSRQKTFSVVEIRPDRFYVATYENRKRVYVHPDPNASVKWFPTQAKAEKAAKKLRSKADITLFRDLSPVQRREYWELRAMCSAHDITMREAIERGCGKSGNWPTKIHAAFPEFKAFCTDVRKLRKTSINFYADKFNVLFRDYPDATFADFPAPKLKQLIKSFKNGVEWEKGAVRAISAFWNWGSKLSPPIAPYGITRTISLDHPKRARQIQFLTVQEVALMLHAASNRWSRNALALMFFTGLRKNEVEQMQWDWIDFEEKRVWVPEHVSKTEGGRLIEGAPNVLWQWLKRPGIAPMVCDHQMRDQITVCAKAAKVPKWPHSGTRHTFATYHFAAHREAEKTRAIMGHDEDGQTMEQRYKGVSIERDSQLYFATQTRGLEFLGLTPEVTEAIAAAVAKEAES